MGIIQPLDRDISDLDAASKFHVIAHVDYIRYYIAGILQFQLLKALCPTGQINCDLRAVQRVGQYLHPAMMMGKSEVLLLYTNSRRTYIKISLWAILPR